MLYRLDDTLGEGDTGPIRRGTPDRVGGRPVAVRMFDLDDDELVHLRRHAEALAMVGHPNLGLIEDATRTDGDSVLVATTLGAETLTDRLQRDPLGSDEALRLIEALAEALAAAHRAVLPHGSVHAGNVVWSSEKPDRPMLIDLGLARFRDGVVDAPVPPSVWRADRHELVQVARTVVAHVAPTTTRAAALIELVAARGAAIVDDEDGLTVLAKECERIRRRPDLRLVEAADPAPVDVVATGPTKERSATGASRYLVAACALVVGGVVGLSITAPRDPLPVPAAAVRPVDCAGPGPAVIPVGAVSVPGDVDRDGDGCADDVWWSSSDAVLHLVDGTGVERFRVGQPGDQALLGDWDCDGEPTVGLYRPRTGETFHFAAWAGDGKSLDALPGPVTEPNGTARPVADDECEAIAVG